MLGESDRSNLIIEAFASLTIGHPTLKAQDLTHWESIQTNARVAYRMT